MKKGFTLIELLVVVLIIGILVAVALPQYQKAVRRARSAEYMAWVKRIVEAEKEYYMVNGRYTGNVENLNLDYKFKWPSVSIYSDGLIENTTATSPSEKGMPSSLHIFVYGGYHLLIRVSEPWNSYGEKVGGYGAELHSFDASRNYPLVCAEYACYGTPAGSFCKDVLGCQGEPIINGERCFRLYKLP